MSLDFVVSLMPSCLPLFLHYSSVVFSFLWLVVRFVFFFSLRSSFSYLLQSWLHGHKFLVFVESLLFPSVMRNCFGEYSSMSRQLFLSEREVDLSKPSRLLNVQVTNLCHSDGPVFMVTCCISPVTLNMLSLLKLKSSSVGPITHKSSLLPFLKIDIFLF